MKVETSALAEHKVNTGHEFDWNNTKVIRNKKSLVKHYS
jgi:hypothetical protein